MTKEKLKEMWYYIIKVEHDDRYLWEVYADNELLYIETNQKEAEKKLEKITNFIQKQN